LDPSAAGVMHDIEVDVDIEHLRPNTGLLEVLADVAAAGRRVVAVSDTYYSRSDLIRMLQEVAGSNPIVQVYTSADVGLTKHRGEIFRAVADAEGVDAADIVHVGDNYAVDVERARAASWSAVHLPLVETNRLRRLSAQTRSVRTKMARMA
jgi:predicted HAD superfamily hydrolase